MPSDDVIIKFIEGIGPELLFCIGFLVILAYVVVKSIPMVKEIRLKKLDHESEIENKKLDLDQKREAREAEEAEREDERNRDRIRVIGQQNEILSALVRSNDALTIQMATLNASLEDSKDRSRVLAGTVKDTNGLVHDIHEVIMKKRL